MFWSRLTLNKSQQKLAKKYLKCSDYSEMRVKDVLCARECFDGILVSCLWFPDVWWCLRPFQWANNQWLNEITYVWNKTIILEPILFYFYRLLKEYRRHTICREVDWGRDLAVLRDKSSRCFYTSCISFGSSLTFQGCLYCKQFQKIKIVFSSRAKVGQVYTWPIIKYWVLYTEWSSVAWQTHCVHIIYLGYSSSPPWDLWQGKWTLVAE